LIIPVDRSANELGALDENLTELTASAHIGEREMETDYGHNFIWRTNTKRSRWKIQ
jgi:hypothetical protein